MDKNDMHMPNISDQDIINRVAEEMLDHHLIKAAGSQEQIEYIVPIMETTRKALLDALRTLDLDVAARHGDDRISAAALNIKLFLTGIQLSKEVRMTVDEIAVKIERERAQGWISGNCK